VTVLTIGPDQDPWQLKDLQSYDTVQLQFEKFTDGRAYTQALVIRQRLGFKGALRATGAVLVDQVAHMARVGFNDIELRHDQSLSAAQKALGAFTRYYQGDTIVPPKLSTAKAAQ
jgi:uncharacterized protein (DUF934 family)